MNNNAAYFLSFDVFLDVYQDGIYVDTLTGVIEAPDAFTAEVLAAKEFVEVLKPGQTFAVRCAVKSISA